jgi:hypothetical protein
MMVHKAQVAWGALASAGSGAVYPRSGALTEVPRGPCAEEANFTL